MQLLYIMYKCLKWTFIINYFQVVFTNNFMKDQKERLQLLPLVINSMSQMQFIDCTFLDLICSIHQCMLFQRKIMVFQKNMKPKVAFQRILHLIVCSQTTALASVVQKIQGSRVSWVRFLTRTLGYAVRVWDKFHHVHVLKSLLSSLDDIIKPFFFTIQSNPDQLPSNICKIWCTLSHVNFHVNKKTIILISRFECLSLMNYDSY